MYITFKNAAREINLTQRHLNRTPFNQGQQGLADPIQVLVHVNLSIK